MDARRIGDGNPVYIKRVKTGDDESQITSMLSSEPLRRDPRNHSVPVFDMFPDDEDPSISYMVMPLLRLIDQPAFDLVEEVIDFIDQILEVCPTFVMSLQYTKLRHNRAWCSCTSKA